jgi:hypothetical protein
MRLHHWMMAMGLCAATAVALAKLPPPTPEQEQAAAEKKAKQQAQLEQEKRALERAQDRVVEYYKRTKGSAKASTQAGGTVEDTNMPKTVRVLPGQAGPQGGREQSAEAHSTPAK